MHKIRGIQGIKRSYIKKGYQVIFSMDQVTHDLDVPIKSSDNFSEGCAS
jgi:hypothetical protein